MFSYIVALSQTHSAFLWHPAHYLFSHCTAACFQFKSRKPLVYFQSCILRCPCWANSIILMCWLNKHVIFFLILLPCMDHNLVLLTLWNHTLSKWISLQHVLHLGSVTGCIFCSMLETKMLQWFILFRYPSSCLSAWLSVLCSFLLLYFPPFIYSACRFAKYATPLGEAWHHVPAVLGDAARPEAHLSAYVPNVFYKTVYQCVQCICKLSSAKKLF